MEGYFYIVVVMRIVFVTRFWPKVTLHGYIGNLIAHINVGIQHVICKMFINYLHATTFQQE